MSTLATLISDLEAAINTRKQIGQTLIGLDTRIGETYATDTPVPPHEPSVELESPDLYMECFLHVSNMSVRLDNQVEHIRLGQDQVAYTVGTHAGMVHCILPARIHFHYDALSDKLLNVPLFSCLSGASPEEPLVFEELLRWMHQHLPRPRLHTKVQLV